MRSGAYSRRLDHILQRERYSVQRAAIAAGRYFTLRVACLVARLFGRDGDECIYLAVARSDACETGFHDFDRRDLPLLDQLRELRERQRAEIVRAHRTCLRSGACFGILLSSQEGSSL